MDWICGIQNAIDYIENHLTDEIDYEEVAKQSSFSANFRYSLRLYARRIYPVTQVVACRFGARKRKYKGDRCCSKIRL